MKKLTIVIITFFILFPFNVNAQKIFESDTVKTSKGDLVITFIGHGTLYFTYNNKIIHIDPVSRYADYSRLPKADIILITHHHGDHMEKETIELISKDDTDLLLTETCFNKIEIGNIINNGETKIVKDITVDAVPAYNLINKRKNGDPFHPKGQCNGYVITFGDKRIYIAGDTENFPKMKDIKGIDIAFLPMNLPYTMTPEMVVDAVEMISPNILYPYHFGKTDTNELLELLKDKKHLEVRIRKMN